MCLSVLAWSCHWHGPGKDFVLRLCWQQPVLDSHPLSRSQVMPPVKDPLLLVPRTAQYIWLTHFCPTEGPLCPPLVPSGSNRVGHTLDVQAAGDATSQSPETSGSATDLGGRLPPDIASTQLRSTMRIY